MSDEDMESVRLQIDQLDLAAAPLELAKFEENTTAVNYYFHYVDGVLRLVVGKNIDGDQCSCCSQTNYMMR